MRILFFLLCFLWGVTTGLNAQNSRHAKNTGTPEHGYYGSLTGGTAQVNSTFRFEAGIRGAWIFRHFLAIGLAGNLYTGDIQNPSFPGKIFRMLGGYGGIVLEPVLLNKKKIRISMPLLIGWGIVNFIEKEDKITGNHFIFKPALEAKFTATQFFNIGLGLGYKITNDIHWKDEAAFYPIPKRGVQGLFLYLALEFGTF